MYDYEVNQTSGYVDKGIGFSSIYVEAAVSQGPDDVVEYHCPCDDNHWGSNPADSNYFFESFLNIFELLCSRFLVFLIFLQFFKIFRV